jgi:predicted transcriptional regulator
MNTPGAGRGATISERILTLQDINDKEAIIQWEEVKDDWRRIKQATRKPRTGVIQSTQKVVGGPIVEIMDRNAMNTEIQNTYGLTTSFYLSLKIDTSSQCTLQYQQEYKVSC